MMEKRSYNIFFDLHTVSGIVISVLLYVIFFAGSFSFFRDEIVNWERNETVTVRKAIDADVDIVLDSIAKKYALFGRDITFRRNYDERRVMVNLSNSKDTTVTQAGDFFYLDTKTFKTTGYEDSYTLGEFLYRLHFFAQIPYPAGYYLSGFTALFFFFAILTGILVHWKKIISNFYTFRPWAKLKTVWTDAHTALGTIGLPFQVVYAVTGAFLMINIVLVAPNVLVLYQGDQQKIYEDLGYEHASHPFENKKLRQVVKVNDLVVDIKKKWRDFDVTEIEINNYGDEGMHITLVGEVPNAAKFTGLGEITYKAATGEIVGEQDPYAPTSYRDGVKNSLYRLHFGDYGGYGLKFISFVLGLLSCFVIISGILIWLEARNKKHIPEKRKRFNNTVGHIYLAICLTLYPVTALSFIVTKLVPRALDPSRQTILYSVFFLSWLALSVFFWWRKNNYLTNKYTLLAGSVLGVLIPVVNGAVTGNWIWLSLAARQSDFFVIDALWLMISLAAFYTLYHLKKPAAMPVLSEDDSEAVLSDFR
ncbi:MAG TPA: PepSY-associated TM helix domain-containing protein [Chryseolinea sp.]